LVAVNDPTLFEDILNMNGGQKIQAVYPTGHVPKWSRTMLANLFDEQVKHHNESEGFKKDKEAVLDIAEQSGSPGFLLSVLAHNHGNSCIDLRHAKSKLRMRR